MKKNSAFKLAGYIQQSTEEFGFGLPLFVNLDSPKNYFVQEVSEIAGTIQKFVVLRFGGLEVYKVKQDLAAGEGDRVIYVFVNGNQVHVGNLVQLEEPLREAARLSKNTAVFLQIMELVGSRSEKHTARVNTKRMILSVTGKESADKFYSGSALHSSLWDRLIESAPSLPALRRILDARKNLTASIDAKGKVTVDLSQLNADDLSNIDVDALCEELSRDFLEHLSSEPLPTDVSNDEPDQPKFRRTAIEAVEKIARAKWHEERIAILADYVLRDRNAGRYILKLYPTDRSAYGTAVIESLRDALSREEEPVTDTEILKLVLREFSHTMSTTRASLLYSLAKHLAKHPAANSFLRRKLETSRSYYVGQARKDMEEFLNHPRLC